MDKIKVGIPRALNYYYFSDMWDYFFSKIGVDIIKSPPTNKEILNKGIMKANDEMCLSLKVYIGHVDYLKDKCDYILIPRIDNYGLKNQTCTNFLALYDIVNNLFDVKILDYNIDNNHNEEEFDGFIKIGKMLEKNNIEIIKAYEFAKKKVSEKRKDDNLLELKKLNSNKKKVLIISHSYNLSDEYIGTPIIKYLEELGIEIICADKFDSKVTNELANKLSDTIYFKYSKENIGAIPLIQDKIDGIIFLSTFPCGLDSLVNELVIRKIDKPYLNLVIDDMDSLTGTKTRLESFVDILEQK